MLGKWFKLYSTPTEAELAIEPAIAALGHPYRAQHPLPSLGWVIPDFVVFDRGLDQPGWIIEVDGESHRRKGVAAKDAARTAKLEAAGWQVTRCLNEEAISDPKGTITRLALLRIH